MWGRKWGKSPALASWCQQNQGFWPLFGEQVQSIGLLVQPRVVSRTTIIDRRVVQLAPGLRLADDAISAQDSTDKCESDNGAVNLQFWNEFTDKLELDDPGQPVPAATRHSNLSFALAPSGQITWVSAFIGRYKQHAGVYLTWAKGPFGDAAYEALLQDRDEIEAELGIEVRWESNGENQKVVVRKNFTDVAGLAERPEVHAFLADGVNRFVNAFRARMRRLAEEIEQ